MLPICRPLGVRGGLACCQQLPALSASQDNAHGNSDSDSDGDCGDGGDGDSDSGSEGHVHATKGKHLWRALSQRGSNKRSLRYIDASMCKQNYTIALPNNTAYMYAVVSKSRAGTCGPACSKPSPATAPHWLAWRTSHRTGCCGL